MLCLLDIGLTYSKLYNEETNGSCPMYIACELTDNSLAANVSVVKTI